MPALLVNFTAVILYIASGAYLISSLIAHKPLNRVLLFSVTTLALAVHALGCYHLIVQTNGLALELFAVLSMIFVTVNLIVLLSAARRPVENLFLFLSPLSALAIIAAVALHGTGEVLPLTFGLACHILLSVLAYSLLTIASLQALFLAYQNHQLKHKRSLTALGFLPPLQTMEALLFEMLWAGQILLTLAIISGVVFIDDIFAQHVVHKTVFTIIAWFIYSILLWGRHRLGWRGLTAIRWTLVGFVMLMSAYFGSKLVLEFILHH